MEKLESNDLPSFEDALNDALAGLEENGFDDISQGHDITIVLKTNGLYTDDGQMRVNARIYVNGTNHAIGNDIINDLSF